MFYIICQPFVASNRLFCVFFLIRKKDNYSYRNCWFMRCFMIFTILEIVSFFGICPRLNILFITLNFFLFINYHWFSVMVKKKLVKFMLSMTLIHLFSINLKLLSRIKIKYLITVLLYLKKNIKKFDIWSLLVHILQFGWLILSLSPRNRENSSRCLLAFVFRNSL